MNVKDDKDTEYQLITTAIVASETKIDAKQRVTDELEVNEEKAEPTGAHRDGENYIC